MYPIVLGYNKIIWLGYIFAKIQLMGQFTMITYQCILMGMKIEAFDETLKKCCCYKLLNNQQYTKKKVNNISPNVLIFDEILVTFVVIWRKVQFSTISMLKHILGANWNNVVIFHDIRKKNEEKIRFPILKEFSRNFK